MRFFQRALLQQILSEKLDAWDRIHFSKRFVSYTEPTSSTEPIVLTFKDGTTATCDIVIGSDGIRSAVRRNMFTDLSNEAERDGRTEEASRLRGMIEPTWVGEVTYRGLIPASDLSEELKQFADRPQIVRGFLLLSRRYTADPARAYLQLCGKNRVRLKIVHVLISSSRHLAAYGIVSSDGGKVHQLRCWGIHSWIRFCLRGPLGQEDHS